MNLPAFYGENGIPKKSNNNSNNNNDQFLAPSDYGDNQNYINNDNTQNKSLNQKKNQKAMSYDEGSSYPRNNSTASNQRNVQQANYNNSMNRNYQVVYPTHVQLQQQRANNNYGNYQQYNQLNGQPYPQQRYSYYVQIKNWCSRDNNWMKGCLICAGVSVGCVGWLCCCCCCRPARNNSYY